MRLSPGQTISFSRLHVLAAALFASVLANPANAHPVPRGAHDRTVTVRLTPEAVFVDYRLEVDQWTIIFQDLQAVAEKVNLAKLSKPREFWMAFEETYAPILADNLIATVAGQPLTFTCVRRSHEIIKPDNNLRCDFVFRALWQPPIDQPAAFAFRDGNFEMEVGLLKLSLASEAGVDVRDRIEPSEALKAKSIIDLAPGDDGKLRTAKAMVRLGQVQPSAGGTVALQEEGPPSAAAGSDDNLLALLLDSQRGFWMLVLLAAGFGAAHALTPGHGKTLVAAYLVGERGTAVHAVVLGLVTTLTHTGAVLLLAGVLLVLFPKAVPAQLQIALGLGGGLLVAGMGIWLLLRRLSGGADHIHIGGGHSHDLPPASEGVRWWNLVVLGMSGGIVPCWDAIAMFGFAVSAQRLWLGFPLLLAFSAGLASVLVLIGLGVVYVKGFATSRLGDGGFIRLLPVVSAVLVTVMGLWLCYESLNPRGAAREARSTLADG